MWVTRTAWPISRLPGRRARPRDRRRRRSGCGSHPRCCPGRGRPSPPPTTRRLRRAASTSPRRALLPCGVRAVTTPWPHRAPPSVNTTLRKRQALCPGRTGSPGESLPAPRCPTVPCVADVLIIEDDATIRTALVRALTARSHSTMTSPTAMDGLQSLVAHRPDVVLLDLGLPDLGGASLLAMIRSVSDVPVIVVSARDDGDGIVAVLDAGADDDRPGHHDLLRPPQHGPDPRVEHGDDPVAVVPGTDHDHRHVADRPDHGQQRSAVQVPVSYTHLRAHETRHD